MNWFTNHLGQSCPASENCQCHIFLYYLTYMLLVPNPHTPRHKQRSSVGYKCLSQRCVSVSIQRAPCHALFVTAGMDYTTLNCRNSHFSTGAIFKIFHWIKQTICSVLCWILISYTQCTDTIQFWVTKIIASAQWAQDI